MPDGLHSHYFRGVTTFNQGHVHGYLGMTSSAPDIPGHTHYMAGDTTLSNGHIHRYALNTSPGIEVMGGHTHYYRAVTTLNDGHVHYIYGYTSVSR